MPPTPKPSSDGADEFFTSARDAAFLLDRLGETARSLAGDLGLTQGQLEAFDRALEKEKRTLEEMSKETNPGALIGAGSGGSSSGDIKGLATGVNKLTTSIQKLNTLERQRVSYQTHAGSQAGGFGSSGGIRLGSPVPVRVVNWPAALLGGRIAGFGGGGFGPGGTPPGAGSVVGRGTGGMSGSQLKVPPRAPIPASTTAPSPIAPVPRPITVPVAQPPAQAQQGLPITKEGHVKGSRADKDEKRRQQAAAYAAGAIGVPPPPPPPPDDRTNAINDARKALARKQKTTEQLSASRQRQEEERRQASALRIQAKFEEVRHVGDTLAEGPLKAKVHAWTEQKVMPLGVGEKIPAVPPHSPPDLRKRAVEWMKLRTGEEARRKREEEKEKGISQAEQARIKELEERHQAALNAPEAPVTSNVTPPVVAPTTVAPAPAVPSPEPETAKATVATGGMTPEQREALVIASRRHPSVPGSEVTGHHQFIDALAETSSGIPRIPNMSPDTLLPAAIAYRQSQQAGQVAQASQTAQTNMAASAANIASGAASVNPYFVPPGPASVVPGTSQTQQSGPVHVFVVNWPNSLLTGKFPVSSQSQQTVTPPPAGQQPPAATSGPQDTNNNRWWRGASQVGQTAGVMGGAGAAGILGLVQAADPFSTFPTFTESVKGLSIELGTHFLPIIDDVSAGFQNMTRWLEGVNGSTKRTAAAWIAAGVAGLALVGVLAKVAAAASAVVALSMAHPVVAGLVAITAAAGTAATAYYLLGKNAGEAGDSMKDASGAGGPRGPGGKSGISAVEFESKLRKEASGSMLSDIVKAKRAGDEDKVKEITQKNVDAAQKELDAANARRIEAAGGERPSISSAADEFISKRAGESKKRLDAEIQTARNNPMAGVSTEMRIRFLKIQEKEELVAQVRKDLRDASYGIPGGTDHKGRDDPERRAFMKEIEDRSGKALEGKEFAVPETKKGRIEAGKRAEAVAEAEKKLESAKKISDLAGTPLSGNASMDRAVSGLPSPRIVDPSQVADAIQIAALKGNDLSAQNLEKQLANLERQSELLRTAVNILTAIDQKSGPAWRGGRLGGR